MPLVSLQHAQHQTPIAMTDIDGSNQSGEGMETQVTTMRLGRPIALGRTAEVYAWEEGYIVKLFRDWMPVDWVDNEAHIARAVYAAGLPVPAIGEVVKVNGRVGLVYERVAGVSMLEAFRVKPWMLFRYARILAQLHVDMHACAVPELPSQRQRLEDRIRESGVLSAEAREAVLKALDKEPDGDNLCHGDFHPDNVLVTAEGPVIIDWMDATRGNPVSDVARTSLLLSKGALPPETAVLARWVIGIMREWFHKVYLRQYFQLSLGDQEQLATWQPVIAAARLWENITEEKEQLVAQVEAGLSRYG
jgi:aminoglycoside phosphotransferase (APT) family kinase protein